VASSRNFGFPEQGDHSETSLGNLSDVPENVSYLSEEPNQVMPRATIGLLWNENIHHLRITNYQEPSYYDEYFMTTSYSTTMQELQENQAKKLARLVRENNFGHARTSSLVEIGCGDGSFLVHASKHFDHVIGIEPSKKFATAAEEKGFRVLNEFVTKESQPRGEAYNAFVSRQVFEHLPDPLDCLRGIRNLLADGAFGLIEVPNGYQAFRKGNFFEFFPDHVNYYSVNSLVSLASTAGFNVVSCAESFGGDYLELWVRLDREHSTWVEKMNKVMLTILSEISQWVDNNPRKSIAIFGCGAKTLSMISKNPVYFSDNFRCVIDSDPNKQGKYVPNTRLLVDSPVNASKVGLDSILILALSYRNEIAKQLRDLMGKDIEIASLDESGDIIYF
jgi:cyclopropane fatty-acyl-phospholipid synthase-like methyltransferase